jgi:hypothetical protein
MSAQNFQTRNKIFGDEILQSGESCRIAGAKLVPLGHLLQTSIVVRNLSLELVKVTDLEENIILF